MSHFLLQSIDEVALHRNGALDMPAMTTYSRLVFQMYPRHA